MGLRMESKYSETVSVGVPQLNITGLPGTALKRLCILGRKYYFPRLVYPFADNAVLIDYYK